MNIQNVFAYIVTHQAAEGKLLALGEELTHAVTPVEKWTVTKQIGDVLVDLITEYLAAGQPTVVSAHKFGDGTFLKNFGPVLQQLLPILIGLLGKTGA